ncbi:MAG: 6-carboxytetrahydropterin synthase QueD, partial [Candidatus Hinthialibacter sp.]
MYEVCVNREFSAAHFLRDYQGKCAELHGHNWKVEVCFRSPNLTENGIMIDFLDIGAALNGLLDQLDHSVINDVPPFDQLNPTSENMARWFYTEITKRMPADAPQPSCVRIWETADACASYWEET